MGGGVRPREPGPSPPTPLPPKKKIFFLKIAVVFVTAFKLIQDFQKEGGGGPKSVSPKQLTIWDLLHKKWGPLWSNLKLLQPKNFLRQPQMPLKGFCVKKFSAGLHTLGHYGFIMPS